MAKRMQVGGEEFEIEDPRQKRMKGSGAATGPEDQTIAADAPPTQQERMEAFKALAQAEAQVVAMFKQLGGVKGSRRMSLAISWLETAFLWAGKHVATTKTPWG